MRDTNFVAYTLDEPDPTYFATLAGLWKWLRRQDDPDAYTLRRIVQTEAGEVWRRI